MSQSSPLRASEWILAGSLLFILTALVVIAKLQAWHYSGGTASAPVVLVAVQIEGFVEKPNVYEVPAGTPIGEVLRKARPKRFADLRSIDQKTRITAPTQLKLESLQSLKVHITGAVQTPETLEVAPGTRICHLRKKISLTPEADLTFFKKQRYLADGETIEIPRQNNI